MQKLEDMNLIDNFLFQEVARNKEYGGEFCRIILETILGREIKEVEIDVEVDQTGCPGKGTGSPANGGQYRFRRCHLL